MKLKVFMNSDRTVQIVNGRNNLLFEGMDFKQKTARWYGAIFYFIRILLVLLILFF